MLGVVNLDKPVGPTSHDMVGLLRRLTGTRRIGHAGTLDPLASGVLPILVGSATRFSEELTGGWKRYDATIRLGARSLTDDAEGPVEPSGAAIPGDDAVREVVRSFVGTFEQVPPAFSARKRGGRTAHRAARAGEPLDLPPRTVVVESIEVVAIDRADGTADVRLDLRCGAGTYVRSLARDVGERLGCGGYLLALRRTEAAGLRAADAVTPGQLEELAAAGRLATAVRPVGDLLRLRRVELDPADAGRFRHGSAVAVDRGLSGKVAAWSGGVLLGVGAADSGQLRPAKVVPLEGEA